MIGIYKIVNKINNKIYIGESLDIYRRWDEHKEDLNENKHHSRKLQSAWNKYGEDNFEFLIEKDLMEATYINNFLLELVLLKYEDIYINKYDSVDNGYNCEYTYQKIKNGERELNRFKIKDTYNLNKYIKIIEHRFEKGKGEFLPTESQTKIINKKQDKYNEYIKYCDFMITDFISEYKDVKPYDGFLTLDELFSKFHIDPQGIRTYLKSINVMNKNSNLRKEIKDIKNMEGVIKLSSGGEIKFKTIGFSYEGYLKMCQCIIDNYKNFIFFHLRRRNKKENITDNAQPKTQFKNFLNEYKNIEKFDGYKNIIKLFLKSNLKVIPVKIYEVLEDENIIDKDKNIINNTSNDIIKIQSEVDFTNGDHRCITALAFTYKGFLDTCKLIIHNHNKYDFFNIPTYEIEELFKV